MRGRYLLVVVTIGLMACGVREEQAGFGVGLPVSVVLKDGSSVKEVLSKNKDRYVAVPITSVERSGWSIKPLSCPDNVIKKSVRIEFLTTDVGEARLVYEEIYTHNVSVYRRSKFKRCIELR